MDLKTLRKPKILGMAIFDWVTSLLAGFLIGKFILRLPWSFAIWILWLFTWILFGIVVHSAFGIHTMLGYYLGLNPKPIRE